MMETKEVRIETSTLCNYRCIFCPHDSDFNREKKIMSFDFFKKILDKIHIEAPNIDFCTLSGMGETFLDPTIFNKIEYAQKLGYKINVLTNASVFNDQNIQKLIDLDIYSLHISFHSANKLQYEKLTKSNKFKEVVDSIKKISKLKKNMKLIVTSVVPEYNNEEINLMRDLIEKDVDLLEIWRPHNWSDWGFYRNGKINKKSCGRPFNGPLQIQIDGTINMCCFDYNGQLFLGDFKTQTLEEIFEGEEFLSLYETHKNGKILESNYICKTCDQIRDVGRIIYYNSEYSEEERVGRVSSTFDKMYEA